MTGRSTCSQCAAPLPAADADGNQVCATCGRFHHGELDGPAAPPPPPGPPPAPPGAGSGAGPFGGGPFGAPPPTGTGTRQGNDATVAGPAFGAGGPKPTPRRSRTGNGVGCIVVLVILVALVGPLVAGVVIYLRTDGSGDSSSDSSSDLSPSSGDLLVLSGEQGPLRAVILASVVGSSDRVVALTTLDGEVAWQAAVVPGDVYSAQFEVTDDLVLASLGHLIVALDRDTGAERWRIEAPDEVRSDCDECFALVGDDGLLAVSVDAQASVVALDTGALRWAERLTSPSGTARAFDGNVLVTDEADAPPAQIAVALLDGSTGDELVRFAPTCPDPAFPDQPDIVLTPYLSTPITRIPGTDDVVLAFGSGRICAQRWDVPTGQVQWSRTADEVGISSDAPGAVSATELVLPGSEQQLVRIGLSEGSISTIALPPDTQPSGPLAVVGSRLVAALQTTRGTPTWVLTAFDLRSGAEQWSRPLSRDLEPFALDSPFSSVSISEGTSAFVTVVDGDRLALVTVTAAGRRVTTERIDPATGDGEVVGTAAFRTSYESTSHQVRIDDVAPDRVVLTADSVIQVLDLTTGSITESFAG